MCLVTHILDIAHSHVQSSVAHYQHTVSAFTSFELHLVPVTYVILLGLIRAFQITSLHVHTWPVACALVSIMVCHNLARGYMFR